MSRAVLVCPDRGSYTTASLGSLPDDDRLVAHADELRAAYDLPALSELDRADRFEPSIHGRPANASPLVLLVGLLDAARAKADHELVAVCGNAMGWHTALAIAGVLGFDDAFRLVQEMALLEEQSLRDGGPGGQVIYPLTDAAWHPEPRLREAVEAVLADDGDVHRSVDLGAWAILGADEGGLGRLLATLPPVPSGGRLFPMRLARNAPHHTPLVANLAAAAGELMAGLHWEMPRVTLIDGRGVRHTPWSASPAELAKYTLDDHLVAPYDFAAGIRVALREYAPDALVLPGPGLSLGAICGQLIVAEGYRGIRSRADFEAAQAGANPPVLAVCR